MKYRYVDYRDLSPLQRLLSDTFQKATRAIYRHVTRTDAIPDHVCLTYNDAALGLLGGTLLDISGSKIANMPVLLLETDDDVFGPAAVMTLAVGFNNGDHVPDTPVVITEAQLRRVIEAAA